MTDKKSESGASETPQPPSHAPSEASELAADDPNFNKAKWMGIGIGSTALVAALMYATKRRPKR